MIRLPLGKEVDRERLHAEYLIRLVRCHAINFGCEDLLKYVQVRYPLMKDRSVTILKPSLQKQRSKYEVNGKEQKRRGDNERLYLSEAPRVYRFLFPADKLDIEKLVWLLLGVPPKSMQFRTIRESLEAVIAAIEKESNEELSEAAKNRINGYAIRFDRLRTQLKEGPSGAKKDTAYWLQEQLKIRTCPYCNANYTRVSSKGQFRADLEHFFPKSKDKYPYLMITLYNLFPACPTCNKLKGDYANTVGERNPAERRHKDCEILFPYDESFNEDLDHRHISFRIVPDSTRKHPAVLPAVLQGRSDQFDVLLAPTEERGSAIDAACSRAWIERLWNEKCGNFENQPQRSQQEETPEMIYWKRARCAIRLFELERVYQFQKWEIQKLLRNHYIYNQGGIYDRVRLIPHKEGTNEKLNQAAVEVWIRDMLFFADTDPAQWGNAPLNKLKTDLLDQLAIWEEAFVPETQCEKKEENADGGQEKNAGFVKFSENPGAACGIAELRACSV